MALARIIHDLEAAGKIPKRIRKRGNTPYVDPEAFLAAMKSYGKQAGNSGWLKQGVRNRQMALWKKETLERTGRDDLTSEEVEQISDRAHRKFPMVASFSKDRRGRAGAKRAIKAGEAAIASRSAN